MIVLINPNSTVSMTDTMLDVARSICPDRVIEGWTSHDGPPAIQGPQDGAACIPPLLALVRQASDRGARVIIIACADDTDLAEARVLAACPVIGIGQAAYHLAALAGARFSVVTTLDVSVAILRGNIHAYGLAGQLGQVRASGVPVLDLERDPAQSTAKVLAEIRLAMAEDDVESVVLGCAGMLHIPAAAADGDIRLIDGVRAAVQIGALM